MDLELKLEKKNSYYQFYCPCCASVRRIRMHPNPNRPVNFLRVGIATLVLTLALYPIWEFKGIISFVPLWMGFELLYRMKVRSILPCPDCGFDPYLFKIDLEKAKQAIDQHWRERFAAKGIAYPKDAPAGASAALTAPNSASAASGASSGASSSTDSARELPPLSPNW